MDALPNDWIALTALVFVLGMRHGLDADHLVAIDGLTRLSAMDKRSHARWCGALFSLGHGAIVVLIALLVGALARAFTPPPWLEDVGVWVSIAFLLALGALNVAAIATTEPHEPVRLVGVRAGFASGLLRTAHPLSAALVGSLFAISFDTVSQAAFFAAAAAQSGGIGYALALGGLFTLGMLVVDGCNGLWMFRLVLRVNRRALMASRVFAILVSSLSFAAAALGAARYFSLEAGRWNEGKAPWLGLAVIALVILAFGVAMRVGRRKPVAG